MSQPYRYKAREHGPTGSAVPTGADGSPVTPAMAGQPEIPPRLLAGWLRSGTPAGLAEHAQQHGALPAAAAPRLVETANQAGLRGRGGAWFPTGRKLATVATNGAKAGGAHVIVNGAESEPAAAKDKLLLRVVPHLVLDGAELAALAVGASEATVCVHRGVGLLPVLRAAIGERVAAGWGGGVRLSAVESPSWYVSSESTALANFVNGGPGKPRSISAYREGVNGKPTLVSNTETFAHLGMIARNGADWFRQAGTPAAPGTWLVTLSGAVNRPGVYEVPVGVSAADVLKLAGGASAPWQAMLLGGYGGAWLPAGETMAQPLTPESRDVLGCGPGAGVLYGLATGACGLAETVRVAGWLAAQNARQCGPCFNGTPAIVDDLARLTWGRDRQAFDRARFRMAMVNRRGACAHPDGVVQLVNTALHVFAADVEQHLAHGGCPGLAQRPLLPVPALPSPAEGWR
jgi:NADH:ubiquinone oxidoreductase subunit F (NADH-binding)